MKNITIFLLLLASFNNYAQKVELPSFKYTGEEFSQKVNKFIAKHNKLHVYISNYISKNYFHLHTSLCNTGIALLKFRINTSGEITEMAVSKTTPFPLSQALKEALMASAKYWHPIKTENSKLLIQPFLYNYHSECKEMQYDFYSLNGGIFEFDDDIKVSNLECIILNPLVTSSNVEEFDLNEVQKEKN